MRTKALTLGLAAVLAVACTDLSTPTETSDLTFDAPEPTLGVLVNDWFDDQEFDFFACGEWNTYFSRDHYVEKMTETPDGQFKFSWHLNSLGDSRVVGWDTGNEYRANPWTSNFWLKVRDFPAYHEHQRGWLVAKGTNVDTKMYFDTKINIHILESGKVIMDLFIDEAECR